MLDLANAFLGLAQMAGAAFGAPFHSGQIVTQLDPVLDDGGSIVTPGTVDKRNCTVQIDVVTESMRLGSGFAVGDVRFIILSASFTGTLDTDANIEVLDGPFVGAWQVSALERDPAAIGWVGKGRPA